MNNLFLSTMKYLCLFDGCGKYASFNYKNEKKKLYSGDHKKEDYGIITRCWTSTHHFHKIQS